MTYGRGRFVAVGENFVITSEDGDTWRELPVAGGSAIAYGNKTFAMMGAEIRSSSDGSTWTKQSERFGTGSQVFFGLDAFFVIGSSGTIIQSGEVPLSLVPPRFRLDKLERLNDGAMSLIINGDRGDVSTIEVSSDLRTWGPLVRSVKGNSSLLDYGAKDAVQRFYRARVEP